MKDFNDLTTGGQFRRFRPVAFKALEQYKLKQVGLTALNHGENTTYRVDAVDENGQKQIYMLRLARHDYHQDDAIHSELLWLDKLAQDPHINAPVAIPTKQGDYITRVEAKGIPYSPRAILFHWVKGRFHFRHNARSLYRTGKLIAQLHNHTAQWELPSGFQRLQWDANGLIGPQASWGSIDALKNDLSPETFERLMEGREVVLEKLLSLEKSKDHFGLIHADLHTGNVVHHNGQACPFDFDDCGMGYHLYDIAIALGLRTNKAELVKACVKGYRSVRPLSDDLLEFLPAFVAARRLLVIPWLFKRKNNPELASAIPGAIQRAFDALQRYHQQTLVARV